tara:strand:+ start:1788 stop:2069 length:282 start_codon:yes stop_codon:yes gene_type:complete
MKITKTLLKQIIKEEYDKESKKQATKDFYEFVKILVAGGTKNQAIHDAVQATEHAENASSEDVDNAIEKAKKDTAFETPLREAVVIKIKGTQQ